MSLRSVSFFIAAALIGTLIAAGIFFWYQGRAARGLSLEITAPDRVAVGEPFELTVRIANDSSSVLKDAQLIVELPEDTALIGEELDKTFETKTLGTLGEGSITEQLYRFIILGGENSVKTVKTTLVYLPSALGSRFEKSATADIAVSGSSVDLDISLPQKIFSGEQLEAKVSYKNVSQAMLKDVRILMEYPPAFSYLSSSAKPQAGNAAWDIGDVRGGAGGDITIKGQLTGADDAVFEFKAVLEANFDGNNYTIAEKTGVLAIAPSPVSLSVTLADDDAIVYPAQILEYKVLYTNTTDVGLKDAVVKAKLSGEMFDLATLSSNAFLKSSDNTLIWNAANTPALAVIAPGASGEVEFRVRLKQAYPIKRLSDKDFMLRVEASLESPTVPYFVDAQKTVSTTVLENKVGGMIAVDAKGFFRDAAAGVINSGPWPMKAGQTTEFTVHWFITNYATDISNVEVRAFLGGNVKFVGVVKSDANIKPEYNENTQEVLWTPSSISAGKGVLGKPLEAVFKIAAMPGINQAGAPMVLLQETHMKATDEFTGTDIATSDQQISSGSLYLDDTTVTPLEGAVQK